jgi:Amt family ammonium transporter
MIVGTLLIWIGYLFFNSAKTYEQHDGIFSERYYNPSKIFTNTLLAGAAGGLWAVIVKPLFVLQYTHASRFDTITLCNGVLAGLVSVSASVDRVENWAAFTIGIMGATFYTCFVRFLQDWQLDDVTEGTAVHFVCGLWGLLASGFFDSFYGVWYDTDGKQFYFSY